MLLTGNEYGAGYKVCHIPLWLFPSLGYNPMTSTTITQTEPAAIAAQNRGPITSVFVPAPSCTETLTLDTTAGNNYLYFGHGNNPYVDYSCIATGTRIAIELVDQESWGSYYCAICTILSFCNSWKLIQRGVDSPAICPQSWSTATNFTLITSGADSRTVALLGPETKAVLCCPSGYSYGGFGHQCTSTVTKNQVLTYVGPKLNGTDGWIRGSVKSTTLTTTSYVWGDGIPIWWQSSDEAALTAASTLMPTQTVSPTTTQTSSSTTQTGGSSDSNTQSSFSTSAKIGLGVGIPLAVLLGLGIGWFVFRHQKANTPLLHSNNEHGQYIGASSKEPVAQQLQGQPRYEMGDHSVYRHELHESQH